MFKVKQIVCVSIVSTVFMTASALAQNEYTLSSKQNSNLSLVGNAMDLYLNGLMISNDGNGAGAGPLRAPISFNAQPGDTLMFVVRNGNGQCSSLAPIYLSCGDFTKAIVANPGFALGTPGALACNRPAGNKGAVQIWHFTIPATLSCTAPPHPVAPSS
jgi:hypothetical protein